MTKDEILEEFGSDLTDAAIKKVESYFSDMQHGDNLYDYIVVNQEMDYLLEDGTKATGPTPGILAGLEVHPLYPQNTDE
jgi:hypothetical protein